MRRVNFLSIILPVVVFIAVFSQQSCADANFPEYDNQNSSSTHIYSGICTSDGVGVLDIMFANMVSNALINAQGQKNYAETAFAFMECYSGGMIDELVPIVGTNTDVTSFTSAAQHDKLSYYKYYDNQSCYNKYYSQRAGGATAYNQYEASKYGYENDEDGPIKGDPVLEHPQYVWNCQLPNMNPPTLYRKNLYDQGPNKYRAIIFGGSTNESANYNSVSRIYSNLSNRGYSDEEIYLMYPNKASVAGCVVDAGTTYCDMLNAWSWMADETDSSTQVYFWSSICHGFEFYAVYLPPVVLAGNEYDFDLTDEFINEVSDLFYFFKDRPDANSGKPYFEVVAPAPVEGLSVVLNDGLLPPLSIGLAGTDYLYKFSLDQTDIGNLITDSSVEFNWTGGGFVDFTRAGITTGDMANAMSGDIPEPTTLLLFTIAGLLIRRR